MRTTEGHLLGGRVHFAQPAHGFRSGIEPVLLAAAVAAREGQRVLEAGSGAGAGLLCLAARVSGITGVGVEADPGLVTLAARNAAANRLVGLGFVASRIEELPELGWFDHAFANPPYHLDVGSLPPGLERRAAKHSTSDVFAVWAHAMASRLRHRGTITLVSAVANVPACLRALLDVGCGSAVLLPLWPRAGQAAKLAILQAVKAGRGGFRVLPGLTLHACDGNYTQRATAILRNGAALRL